MSSFLILNAGSSSIRFALYRGDDRLERRLHGKVDRIGLSGTCLSFNDPAKNQQCSRRMTAANHPAATEYLIDWLAGQEGFDAVTAIGHRVVHGMQRSAPEWVTPALLEDLHRISPYDPEHLPAEIALIEAFARRYPKLPQLACFDTAFHQGMPRIAKLLPIPRRLEAGGVQRYGFHGLSYAYLMEALSRMGAPAAAKGRVIMAHLGNGASLAALRQGQCIDTSMGFTPASGMMMSTRSGDLDPALAFYLSGSEAMSPAQFQHMVNHQSGLLGVSGLSSDMRDLLAAEAQHSGAAEAVALFCYQARKWIGAYAAALGGLDVLVFSGGIGENAAPIRWRICEGLGFLGIEIDESRNQTAAGIISSDASRVCVRIIRTDEEVMIARSLRRALDPN